MLVTVNILVNT